MKNIYIIDYNITSFTDFMRKYLYIGLLLSLIYPFTLHSTDIYISSEGKVKIYTSLNPWIIPGDMKLGSTVLVVSTPNTNEGVRIISSCDHRESILYEKTSDSKTLYVIELRFPNVCEQKDIFIGDKENVFTDTIFSPPLSSTSETESIFMNTKSSELLDIMRSEVPKIQKGTGTAIVEKLDYIETLYKNLSMNLRGDIARDILNNREESKYTIPVNGYNLPTKDNAIPGTGRPHRRNVTDGIHHGWDIMAPVGTPVQALTKGKIIRIVNDWTWDDFNKLKRSHLTTDDLLTNLDIYRGNQIWLQGMDGNVTFYSHLSRISPDITIGTQVDTGDYIGNIGITGVPDKNYKDVHLHFEIQVNPFREDMKNPNYLDIMRWNYE